MKQVICWLCNTKTDKIKRKEHLVSTNHLESYKNKKDKIAMKFFEMIFNACPKKSKIFNLKSKK